MIVKTYLELEAFIKMFKEQQIDLLIVLSRGGLGKTQSLKKIMGSDEYVYVNTHSTPLETYKQLYYKRDVPVVFDDTDAVTKNNIMLSLFKSLADTIPIKTLHYQTSSPRIGEVPSNFNTASNCCILLNEFDINNRNIAPLIDRGFFIEFSPSREEVLKKIEKVAKSQSIANQEKCVLEFVKENYKKIDNFSIRTYIKALQLFRADEKNWKERFLKMIGFDEKLVNYITLKEKYKTDKERIEHFNWSRATYFRVKQDCEGNQ
jgi:hypothetical protein